MNALEIRGLCKTFKEFKLEGIDLTLPCGCIMGLIGENGAGKSTTIKLILDVIKKDGGTVKIFEKKCASEKEMKLVKEEIGVVMDEAGIPECLNAEQVGKIMCRTYKNWDTSVYNDCLKKLDLPTNVSFGKFSRGMKMKLSIAIALSHRARLLILDEPTSGLDPVVRDEVVEILYDFTRDENNSVLISSHIVSDLERLCDYIVFLHKGKLLICEEKDRLLEQYGIVYCTNEELEKIDADALRYKKSTPYGAKAIVLRDKVPSGMKLEPISIEELFVFMVKEEG